MKDPVAGKLGVRKAIAYLLDRDALVNEVYQRTRRPRCTRSSRPASPATTRPSSTPTAPAPQPAKAEAALRADGITGKVKLTLWSTPSPLRPRHRPGVQGDRQAAQRQRAVRRRREVRRLRPVREGHRGRQVRRLREGLGPRLPGPRQLHRRRSSARATCWATTTATARSPASSSPRPPPRATAPPPTTQYGELQDIVAAGRADPPVWQAKQYAVARDNVYGLEYCLDASTVFRFWEISKG